MIVYGDQVRVEDARAKRDAIDDLIRQASLLPHGIERHAMLVAALIEAGELAQGLGDARLAATGVDEADTDDRSLLSLATRLAAAVGRSWDSGFAAFGPVPSPAEVAGLRLEVRTVMVRQPEGFAHYAVYPEAYWTAARSLDMQPAARVFGIRSIGTALGPIVAAGLGARVPVTLRPIDHPFARRLALGPSLGAELSQHRGSMHAIVDEGPGFSGSSFGAVADALEDAGVPSSDIVFFPSHAGEPGTQASVRHRTRWRAARRPFVSFDDLTGRLARPVHRLESWVEDLIGPLSAPLESVAGGRWRALLPSMRLWPPADAPTEKLKFIATTSQGRFLLRFAGLGLANARKKELALQLADAGFGIRPLGWRHGFQVEPWRDDCQPVEDVSAFRGQALWTLPRYCALRAEWMAPDEAGASLEDLLQMCRVNIAEGVGTAEAREIDHWSKRASLFSHPLRRIVVDARLHVWEWLATPDGRLLKTDAVDHHAGHDLVGCQPVEWDIAGALTEWRFGADDRTEFIRRFAEQGGRMPDSALLRFFQVAYPAFQLGAYRMAADRAEPAEGPRLLSKVRDYRDSVLEALSRLA